MKEIQTHIVGQIISSNDSEARALHKKSHFGELVGEKIQYSLPEALYLIEKGKMEILVRNKKLSKKEAVGKLRRLDKKIQIKYPVFKDLRDRGYIVKTALKFGAEFRVYDKGHKPGKRHARWLLFTEHESKKLGWHEFAAKNRVAHSTRKNLLLAIVDDEGKITYYDCRWIRP